MNTGLISVSSGTYVAEWKNGKPRKILGKVTALFGPPKATAVDAYAKGHPEEKRQDVYCGEICTYVYFYSRMSSEESKTAAREYASLME